MNLNFEVENVLVYFSFGCAIITFFMCLLHLLLTLGFPLGEYVLGGNNRVIPKEKRYINGILAVAFWLFGVLYLEKADAISLSVPLILSRIVMIVYTLFLAYAIVGNTFFSKSKKEKIVMIPSSIIGFICSLLTLVLSW